MAKCDTCGNKYDKTFDVVIEGISYVRNFRAELNSEIQNSSLDAVIARLQTEKDVGVAE